MKISILKTSSQKDYELLDSGDGEKLERYGKYILRRPDPQALSKKNFGEDVWEKADAFFSRDEKRAGWHFKKDTPKSWEINFGGLNLKITPSAFKHTGLFPEQLSNWEWTEEKIKNQKLKLKNGEEINILNLFGYTGGATLACAKAGAKVTHVDASKTSIGIARDNAKLSNLESAPVRWILDDAVAFVKKEIKRGKKYDGIIMDPPAFGRGPDGEVWKIENDFLPFLSLCKELLSENPLFFLVNGYASGYSSVTYLNNIEDLQKKYGGEIENGELFIEETSSGRLLSAGIFSRWSKI